jgi:dihydroorotase
MNAERVFLKHFEQIHLDFPKLKMVLEHASTKEAVDMVKRLGDTVGCTITIHHLYLTVDDWAGQSHHFCKPVAKYPHDRKALQQVILDGHPRFFLGTDSAPHPRHTKECAIAHAGVYTGVHTLALLAHVLDSFGAMNRLEDFARRFGRQFYHLPLIEQPLPLQTQPMTMPAMFQYQDENQVTRELVPFLAGREISYSINL